jgi:hypothetical protein
MNYLHYDLNLSSGDVVVVSLDKQANVQLMDDSNFSNYRRGQRFTYSGGRATTSPATVRPPHAGRWHLVIDLGGQAGTVRASVNIRKG